MWVKLSRDIGFGDSSVMRREMVALVTQNADPDLGGEIHAAKGVESRHASLAAKRRVRERGDIGM